MSRHDQTRHRSARRRVLGATAVVLGLAALLAVIATSASAHLRLSNGVWTYRVFSKADDAQAYTHCQNGTGSVDPMSIIIYQYGEYSRIDSHILDETNYYDRLFASDQIMCGTNDGSTYFTHVSWREDRANGPIWSRSHYRHWYAPHGHSSIVDKWSALTPHHESGDSHEPDESWEKWEQDLVNQMSPEHNDYRDAYCRYQSGNWRLHFWNGCVSRIGGLHNGQY